jgi:para-nitrobenzyl esterase
MASPLAKDALAKAIGESGGAFYSGGLGYPPLEKAEAADAAWAERVFGSAKLKDLRAVAADDLVKAAMTRPATASAAAPAGSTTGSAAAPTPRFGPDIDGWFLPDSVPNLYAAGKQAHIPLRAGWNANESRPRTKPTAESWAADAKKLFGDHAQNFLAVYPGSTDEEAVASAGDFASDQFIAFSTWSWLEAHQRTGGAPVYRYLFDLPSPGDKNHKAELGTFHSDDIEYVFGTLDSRPEMKIRPEDRQVSELMQAYWTNFARTGDPNGQGSGHALPKWPKYTPEGQWPVMHLDSTPGAKPDANRGRDLFLDSEWGKAAGK